MVEQKVDAVVTGAASGIGRACAYRIRQEGSASSLSDTNAVGLRTLHHSRLETLIADVTSEEARDRVVKAGTGARYLVNAAGVIRSGPSLSQACPTCARSFRST